MATVVNTITTKSNINSSSKKRIANPVERNWHNLDRAALDGGFGHKQFTSIKEGMIVMSMYRQDDDIVVTVGTAATKKGHAWIADDGVELATSKPPTSQYAILGKSL